MNTVRYSSDKLFNNFKHLEVHIEPEQKTVWLYFNSQPRSCYTLTLLKELDKFQSILRHHDGKLSCKGTSINIEYCVITSRHPVFSFGGDLDYFIQCIENNDRESLTEYAKYCIGAVYYSYIGREFDITTISLIHGNALGGGFEAALSSQILIAEQSAEMGFPEVLFDLFPGMGAYNLLTQRVSPMTAEKIMLSGKLYSADELKDIGVIDTVVEDGGGIGAVNAFIHSNRHRINSFKAIRKVRQISNPIDYQELIEIGNIWVDMALKISEKDLRTMARLVRSQKRFSAHNNDVSVSRVTSF
jgi:DSF synthase